MTETVIPYRFLVRGGTAAALAAANEIPKRRELYFELDTGKFKLGDGVTAYNSLGYVGDGVWQPEDLLLTSLSDLSDPGGDRILFWDESNNALKWLTLGSGLSITDDTINAAISGGMTLIGSQTLGAAGGTLTVTGLDLNTHKKYEVRARLKNNTGTPNYVMLNYNGVTTPTDYDSQVVQFLNTTTSSARFNDASICYLLASSNVCGSIEVMHDFDGKPSATSKMRGGTTSSIQLETHAHHYRTAGNVTSIQLTCASNFAAGSSIEVWA